jgi:hypothetical protein
LSEITRLLHLFSFLLRFCSTQQKTGVLNSQYKRAEGTHHHNEAITLLN